MSSGVGDPDTIEGHDWRLVRMSGLLFRLLGAGGVDWGEPDEDGVYTPTVYLGPDGKMLERQINDEIA